MDNFLLSKVAYKIYNDYRILKIATYLTQQQRDMLQYSVKNRRQGMDFGEKFSNQRTYIYIGKISEKKIQAPRQIIELLNNNEYSIVDYRKGIAQKYNKKLNKFTQKGIGKIINQTVKDKKLLALFKKMFEQRLGTSKKDYEKIDFCCCITHKPEDIAGMSTNRNWTSCMRLPGVGSNDGGGEFYYTSLNQVQYGGMCAYLIDEDDKTINRPYARIAIKRFQNAKGDFIYKAQHRIYGDEDLAGEVGFMSIVEKAINQSNQVTLKSSGVYYTTDYVSYSDGDYKKIDVVNKKQDLLEFNEQQFLSYFFNKKQREDLKYYIDNKDVKPWFIQMVLDYIDVDDIDFMKRNEDKFNWDDISAKKVLSQQALQYFKNKLNWKLVFSKKGEYDFRGINIYKYKDFIKDFDEKSIKQYPNFDIKQYCSDKISQYEMSSMMGSNTQITLNNEEKQYITCDWEDMCDMAFMDGYLWATNDERIKDLKRAYRMSLLFAVQKYLNEKGIKNINPKNLLQNYKEMLSEQQSQKLNNCINQQLSQQQVSWELKLIAQDKYKGNFKKDGVFQVEVSTYIDGNRMYYQRQYAYTIKQLKQKIDSLVKQGFDQFPVIY